MKIPIIVGVTASGKTEIAVKLKEKFSLEIISADSRQIYKYLSIGTNKPQGKWVKINDDFVFVYKDVNYHLVDFLEPDKEYNALEFYKDATKCINKIFKNHNLAVIVGGTGLYIKTITDGISLLPKRSNKIREELKEKLEFYGKEYLYNMLYKLDPKRAKEIHPNNINRIIRSLEIIIQTGEPFSELVKKLPKTKSYDVVIVGFYLSKQLIKKRIISRTEWMFKNGVIEETRELLNKGYDATIPAFTSIGYNWIVKFINNEISLDTAKENFIKDTLDYAKRQMTWFKKDKRIFWIDCDTLSEKEVVKKIYDKISKELNF
ncbi:MAG: tRNA (adenosine(37)-N6)-dimethylallyltransferase MiaA [Endomicrobiia bacterium]